MKLCGTCGETKPLTEYYINGKTPGAHCKECTKAHVKRRYTENRAERSAYERMRYQRPERRAAANASLRRYRERYPDRYRARYAVKNAVRDGRLKKLPCEVCGTTVRVQAHHHDYSKPLDVQWLCFQHHREHGHGQTVTFLDPTSNKDVDRSD